MPIITFTGKSTKKYDFNLYERDTSFKALPGIYVFLREEIKSFKMLYIGQTSSFQKRIDVKLKEHDQYLCFLRNNYTHIAVLTIRNGEEKRLNIETDLRHNYTTLCNQQ